MGAQMLKEVATKTNDAAGDGTTTATLLAQAMIREGMKNIAAGANPMIVKKGMAKAVETAVGTVIANSKKVEGSDDIARVATVSSADETVGKLIADAMEKVTAEGVITIEESKTAETYSEVVEGMQFDRGYISPYMVTDTEKWKLFTTIHMFLLQIRKSPRFRKSFLFLNSLFSRARSLLSLQRISRAKRSQRLYSIILGALSSALPLRLQVSATDVRKCLRILPS